MKEPLMCLICGKDEGSCEHVGTIYYRAVTRKEFYKINAIFDKILIAFILCMVIGIEIYYTWRVLCLQKLLP